MDAQAPRSEESGRSSKRVAPAGRRPRWRQAVRLAIRGSIALLGAIVTLALVYSVVTPPSTLMLGRWLTGRAVERVSVPLDAVAPSLVQAVLAAEDQRYCRHRGIDWRALREVAETEGGPSRGASTITMQTAKNVFLWGGRSYLRKALELPLALGLDLAWGKRRVLEIYLNVAEWGDGVFGAEAAARHWFGKGAAQLSPTEAALLAAILPNPLARSAARPSRLVRARAARLRALLPRMGELTACVRA